MQVRFPGSPHSSVPSDSSSRSTSIVHWVTIAAIAPTAAQTGNNSAPASPIETGNSMRVRPSSFLMTTWRTLPSRISSLLYGSGLPLVSLRGICSRSADPRYILSA